MSFKFRPMLSALEGREVPASLSFTLPDGTIGTGTFLIPAGVDPSADGQALVTAFQMTLGGWQGTTQPDALALFSYGEFAGLTVAVTGVFGGVQIDGSTATGDDGRSAPVTYDLSDVQLQFLFSDGTPGTVSYEVPWGQVDPAQASQSVTPTGFKLNISGQTFAPGSASFTTAPALTFEYGAFKGVTFAVDTSAAATATGFAFTSVSMSGGLGVTAWQAWNGQALFTTAAAVRDSITIDFRFAKTDPAGAFTIRLTDKDNTNFESIPVAFTTSSKPEDLAQAIVTALDGNETFKATRDGTKVTISAASTKKWAKLIYSGTAGAQPFAITSTGNGVELKVVP